MQNFFFINGKIYTRGNWVHKNLISEFYVYSTFFFFIVKYYERQKYILSIPQKFQCFPPFPTLDPCLIMIFHLLCTVKKRLHTSDQPNLTCEAESIQFSSMRSLWTRSFIQYTGALCVLSRQYYGAGGVESRAQSVWLYCILKPFSSFWSLSFILFSSIVVCNETEIQCVTKILWKLCGDIFLDFIGIVKDNFNFIISLVLLVFSLVSRMKTIFKKSIFIGTVYTFKFKNNFICIEILLKLSSTNYFTLAQIVLPIDDR